MNVITKGYYISVFDNRCCTSVVISLIRAQGNVGIFGYNNNFVADLKVRSIAYYFPFFLLRLGLGGGSTGSGSFLGLRSGFLGLRSGYFGLGSGYFGLRSSYFRFGSSFLGLRSGYFGFGSGFLGLRSGYFRLRSGYFGLGSRSFRSGSFGSGSFGSRSFGSRSFGGRTFRSRSFGSRTFGSGSFGGTLLRGRSTFLGLGDALLGSFFGSFLRSLFGSRGSFGSQRNLADLVQLFPPCELACNVVARRHGHEEHKG